MHRILRAAGIAGVTAGLVATSAFGMGTANATCVSISGLTLGSGCTSTFGSIALVIGTGTADAAGLTAAIATGTDTTADSTGFLSLAYAGGTSTTATTFGGLGIAIGVGTGVSAQAGTNNLDTANIAINLGAASDGTTNQVVAGGMGGAGFFNFALNFLGNSNASGPDPATSSNMLVQAIGSANAAINTIGDRNEVSAVGLVNAAINLGALFRSPNGSDNVVTAGDTTSSNLLTLAFNSAGAQDIVQAIVGPLAIAAAFLGAIGQTVIQTGPGITVSTGLSNASAAAPTNTTSASATLSTASPRVTTSTVSPLAATTKSTTTSTTKAELGLAPASNAKPPVTAKASAVAKQSTQAVGNVTGDSKSSNKKTSTAAKSVTSSKKKN
ncbi:hypothetical protein [Mycobacterium sp. OTB74]|uniref:hypothetical protein n=1 Tax=Mycobacterium sp. OTB74 TaxID=1853452 RepID=UPI002474ACFF|nr:hypothetical protein [Mycobacterium sp. OTB74]